MPFPVAHAITGASIVALSRRSVILSRDWIPLLIGALLATSPDFKPVVNHCERCAELPWVNESGTTVGAATRMKMGLPLD